jgi:integrase
MGLGVVQIVTKAKTEREHQRRVVMFDALVEDSQVEVLRALIEGRVSWEELRDAQRRKDLQGTSILATVALERPLVAAVAETVPKMGKAQATTDRYEDSLNALIAQTLVPWPREPMRVKDLVDVAWPKLAALWVAPKAEGGAGKSSGDWNRLVAAVSRFLSIYLADPKRQPKGNKYHPFRLELMAKIEKLAEVERVPDLTPDVFTAIVRKLPEHIRPCVYTLLLTGFRDRSEYLRCTEENKMPATTQVRIYDRKTHKWRVIAIDPEFWPWVDAGIPSPVQYKALRRYWIQACIAVGVGARPVDADGTVGEYRGLRMHDLRHALGQWTHDAGVPLSQIKEQLRHATLAMSERYSRTTSTRRVAQAMGDILRAAK